MNTRVADIMYRKGCQLVCVNASTTVQQAAAAMDAYEVGAVLVMAGERLLGVFSERDCVIGVVRAGRDPATTRVGDVMTRELVCALPSQSLRDCMELMTTIRQRHLPVTNDDKLVGILSIGDCVAFLCDEAVVENGYLREYIAGRYPG